MKITTVGIDLAKNVFQVHGIDERGKAVLRKQLRRAQVAVFFANLPPCVIGMEACASAHHWARTLLRFGHTVRLMAPQFVKPYVKTNKNDVADAEAICEAVGRPNMRFVPIKSIEQQAIFSVHRVRQGFVKARTAQANQIRGSSGPRNRYSAMEASAKECSDEVFYFRLSPWFPVCRPAASSTTISAFGLTSCPAVLRQRATEARRVAGKADLRRRDSRSYCGATGFQEHVAVDIEYFDVIDSMIRAAIARHFIGFGLGEVAGRDAVGVGPSHVGAAHMMFIYGLPVAHTDISAQDRKVDVLPFGPIAVPLDEGLTRKGPCVGYEPSAHDSTGLPFIRMVSIT